MRVGRPGVRALDPVDQVLEARARGSPQTERAVDVQPRSGALARLRDRRERIGGSRVDVACLSADDRRPGGVPESVAERVRLHPALVVDGNELDRRGPEAEQPQRAVDRHMALAPDEDADPRRSVQAVARDIPAGLRENVLARGCECRRVRALRARDEPARDALRQPQELCEPRRCDILHRRSRR